MIFAYNNIYSISYQMLGEFSQNYLSQNKESNNSGSQQNKTSFIKIKDTVSIVKLKAQF